MMLLWRFVVPAFPGHFRSPANILNQANALAPGWGQHIFQSANEIAANEMLREKLEGIQDQAEAEKKRWEERRGTIQSEFMKELDEADEKKSQSTEGEGVMVESAPGTPSQGSKKKKQGGKK